MGGSRRWTQSLLSVSPIADPLQGHWNCEPIGLIPPQCLLAPRPPPSKRQDKPVQSTVFTKGTKWGASRGAAHPAVTPHSSLNPAPPLLATPALTPPGGELLAPKGGGGVPERQAWAPLDQSVPPRRNFWTPGSNESSFTGGGTRREGKMSSYPQHTLSPSAAPPHLALAISSLGGAGLQAYSCPAR